MAETFIRLLDRADELPRFARFHMDGHYDHDGMQMVRAIGRAVGRPNILSFGFPWRLAGLARAFVPLIKELHEMRYLWRETIRLDNGALREFLGEEPHTPIDVAVRITLESLGCISEQVAMAAPEGTRLMAGGGQ